MRPDASRTVLRGKWEDCSPEWPGYDLSGEHQQINQSSSHSLAYCSQLLQVNSRFSQVSSEPALVKSNSVLIELFHRIKNQICKFIGTRASVRYLDWQFMWECKWHHKSHQTKLKESECDLYTGECHCPQRRPLLLDDRFGQDNVTQDITSSWLTRCVPGSGVGGMCQDDIQCLLFDNETHCDQGICSCKPDSTLAQSGKCIQGEREWATITDCLQKSNLSKEGERVWSINNIFLHPSDYPLVSLVLSLPPLRPSYPYSHKK